MIDQKRYGDIQWSKDSDTTKVHSTKISILMIM